MNKKYIILLATLLLAVVVGITTVALVNQANAKEYFPESGYILGSDDEKKVSFTKETEFNASQLGTVSFKNLEGDTAVLEAGSFVHMEDGSVMALDDGILLDFSDLSSNFINNYYITRTLSITETGNGYTAETDSGSLTFGEYLWKLSDNKYMICSSTLNVYFSDDDIREVSNFVEISVTSDGIVEILTEENTWMTISDQCYIETANGVRINPLTHVIDDGTYQITTSKLVVSADDSIVLTEDETRRQIVPELNIDVVDGQDGEDGTIGEDGTSGDDGVLGEDGEDGTDGEDGASGDDGASGASGAAGSSGVNGANGVKGVDSVVSSSTNTALPVMTITDWNVTGSSLTGTISVVDEAWLLGLTFSDTSAYMGKVTITNVSTGVELLCYSLDSESYSIYDGQGTEFDFTTGADCYYFGTDTDALTPNVQYELSVWAYYQIDETIYSREFISRFFYTDSSGVQISHQSSTTSSANLSVTKTDSAESVTLYLLTAAQNENFSVAAASSESYTAAESALSFGEDGVATKSFTGLASNTKYIARVIVDGILTEQEETFYTLKTAPTWSANDTPTAYYSSVNGYFEVYRPSITDVDGGIEKYEYTAYYRDENNDLVVAFTKTVYPSDSQPVTFYIDSVNLESGVYYEFGITTYFYDNEKTTIYDLGLSDPITGIGATLPKVELIEEEILYNQIDGTIRLTMATSGDTLSTLTVGDDNPLTLRVYAGQVMVDEMTLTLKERGKTYDIGDYEASITTSSTDVGYEFIKINFDNLYYNTNYSITLYGYIDLNDGNDAVYREIGTVSFATKEANTLTAKFSDITSTSDSAMAVSFSLDVQANTYDTSGEEKEYVEGELQQGAVTVQFYEGQGNNKVLKNAITYTDPDDLSKIYGTGIEIDESTFDESVTSGTSYTLLVSNVVDDTYARSDLGYTNTFDDITNPSYTFQASETPPDLSTEPHTQILTEPIYYEDVADYGGTYTKYYLDDDTVVGYKMSSQYDNTQRLAQSVTYYIVEYATFYNALSAGAHPITDDNAKIVEEITLSVPTGTDTVPSIAVLFDDSMITQKIIGGTTVGSGTSAYYVYVDDVNDTEDVFARGYRYVFAYTVEYTDSNSTDNTSTYPDDLNSYDTYKNNYGCGTEMNTTIGKGVAYILNSGMISIPKTAPQFYSYVYDTTATTTTGISSSTTTGTITLHYTYSGDSDNTIIDTNDANTEADDRTYIQYTDTSSTMQEVLFHDEEVTGEDRWYSVELPYLVSYNISTATADTGILMPEVLMQDYINDYSVILNNLYGSTYEDEKHYLAQIPVEYDYSAILGDEEDNDAEKNSIAYADDVRITLNTDNLDQNYITFKLVSNGTADAKTLLMKRAYVLAATFTKGDNTDTFYLPMTTDASGESEMIFSLAELGMDYVSKDTDTDEMITVSAQVLYDNGMQGWSVLDEDSTLLNSLNGADNNDLDNIFALQYINSVSGDEATFDWGGYYTYVTTSKENASSPSGGLLTLNGSSLLASIRGTVDGNKLNSKFTYLTSGTTLTRYLKTLNYGVNVSTQSDNDIIGSYYMVAKHVAAYDLKFDNTSGVSSTATFTLDSITPTIANFVSSQSVDLVIASSFTVTGASQINQDDSNTQITITAYTSYEDAQNLVSDYEGQTVVTVTGDDEDTKTFTYVASTDDSDAAGLINNLDEGETYYIVLSAKIGDNATEESVLLKSGTSEYAIYEVETIDGIQITSLADVVYNNYSYMEKTLYVQYRLNVYTGINVTYNIYNSSDVVDGAVDTEADPLLSHADLLAKGIIADWTVYTTNYLTFNLEPSINRKELVPGGSYYLEIIASTGDGGNTDSVLLPFTITANGGEGAAILVEDASSDSISYKITIRDSQFSLMSNQDDGASAPYLIRFTDSDGNWIQTTYDSQVFYAGNYQQEITFDKNSLTNSGDNEDTIAKETPYTLTIYSLLDSTHNGQSYPTAMNEAGTALDWTTIRSKSYFFETDFTNFQSLLSSFWSTDRQSYRYANDANMDTVEANFAIASTTQKTLDDSNLDVDESSGEFSINTKGRLELALYNSFGLINDDGTQAFSKIEYQFDYWGSTSTATESGESNKEDDDTMFVKSTDITGSQVYTYEIPTDLPGKGRYTVTVYLYTAEDEKKNVPTYTISGTYTYS